MGIALHYFILLIEDIINFCALRIPVSPLKKFWIEKSWYTRAVHSSPEYWRLLHSVHLYK